MGFMLLKLPSHHDKECPRVQKNLNSFQDSLGAKHHSCDYPKKNDFILLAHYLPKILQNGAKWLQA